MNETDRSLRQTNNPASVARIRTQTCVTIDPMGARKLQYISERNPKPTCKPIGKRAAIKLQ